MATLTTGYIRGDSSGVWGVQCMKWGGDYHISTLSSPVVIVLLPRLSQGREAGFSRVQSSTCDHNILKAEKI